MPIVKWARHLFGSPVLMHRRERAISITAATLTIVAAFIFFVPAPLNTVTEGVVWIPEKSYVRASADGFVESVLVQHGEQVSSGDRLIVTSDPLANARLKLLQAQHRELSLTYDTLVNEDIVQANITLEELRLAQSNIDRLQEKIDDLVVKSPTGGEFIMLNSNGLEGHFVKHGDPVAYVINYDDVSVRVVVPQNAIGLVRQNVEDVEIRFVDQMNKAYQADISREIPAATYKLPSKALAQQGGGNIKTDPFDADGIKTKNQYFQFEITMPDELDASLVGQRVYVKILHGYQTFAMQWYRSIKELFLDELGKV
jgi:putative peptide zinc metalloprotease protein